jgi:hypothetical protein
MPYGLRLALRENRGGRDMGLIRARGRTALSSECLYQGITCLISPENFHVRLGSITAAIAGARAALTRR